MAWIEIRKTNARPQKRTTAEKATISLKIQNLKYVHNLFVMRKLKISNVYFQICKLNEFYKLFQGF